MGDTLGLFAAGIVLLLLLIASYSRRGTWLALGSMALSIAVVAACLLLVAIHDPSQGRVRLAWIESKLPLVLDQQTADALAASLERIAAAPPCAAAGLCNSGKPSAPSGRTGTDAGFRHRGLVRHAS